MKPCVQALEHQLLELQQRSMSLEARSAQLASQPVAVEQVPAQLTSASSPGKGDMLNTQLEAVATLQVCIALTGHSIYRGNLWPH